MRLLLAAVVVSLPTGLLTGCGAETGGVTVSAPTAAPSASRNSTVPAPPSGSANPTAPPSATASASGSSSPSEDTAATVSPSTVQAYEALAEQANRFFAAVQAVQVTNPDARPRNAEEMSVLVGYAFTDGVTLAVYDDDRGRICLTGPSETYLSLSESEDEDLRQALGTGQCAYDDGDVVLGIHFRKAFRPVRGRLLVGADLAEQIPALDGIVAVINESFAAARAKMGEAMPGGGNG